MRPREPRMISAVVHARRFGLTERLMTPALGVLIVAYASWQATRWGPAGYQEPIADLFFAPFGVLGVTAAWRAAGRTAASPRLARAWRLLGLAVLSYLLGEVVYMTLDLMGYSPYPSPADAFFLAFYPLILAGLLSFLPPLQTRSERLRFWLDMAVVALGVTAALLYLELGPAAAGRGKSVLATAFSIAYPVGDMILVVGLAAVVLRGSSSSMRRPLYVLAVGLVLFVCADMIYQYQLLHAGYRNGDPVDIVWMTAIAAFTLSGIVQKRVQRPEPAGLDHVQTTWIPYAAVMLEFGVVVVAQRHAHFFPGILMLLVAMSLAGLVSARQVLSQRELMATQGLLRHLALYDELTGLANRTLLYDRLGQALAGRARTGEQLAVLLADLDDFKLVNDTLGHHAGDELLSEVTGRLRAKLRAGETIARLGGDEFCLVAERVASEGEAQRIAERISSVFATPFLLDGTTWHLTASIGIALTNGHPSAPSDLLRDADTAMYRAKASGKGGFELFDTTLRERLVRRVALAAALKNATGTDELELVYQPIVSLADDTIFAVEALARWRHPSFGAVEPGEFIPLAEANGMIVPLGRFVLEQAAAQAARWCDVLPERTSLGVGINVTARELAEPDYADVVLETLTRHRLANGKVHIGLELTERVFIDERNPVVAANMAKLANADIRLVLDDFGSGYSALASLNRFPLASLKIDRLFMNAIEEEGDEAPVIRAIVGLGHALGLRVIAEGVETRVQLDYLRSVGARYGQGYLFGRPSSADETGKLLARGVIGQVAPHGVLEEPSRHAKRLRVVAAG